VRIGFPKQYDSLGRQVKLCGGPSGCGEVKLASEFQKNCLHLDGLTSLCKVCTKKQRAAQHARNPEKFKARKDRAHAKYMAKPLAERRKNSRTRGLKHKYKLTPEEYDVMRANQNNSCAICGRSFVGLRPSDICIDHDHRTGKIRGLLCGHHNRGLGLFDDSPEHLRAAADYVEWHRSTTSSPSESGLPEN
jgi:Recombination endonuclease VII.